MSDETCGMLRISLVDLPAVESDFQKFGKPVRVVMESDEKRLILGVVMRANFPIYRVDEEHGEYYTMFSKESIRKMAEKYLEENRQNRVNLMHCGEEVRGVQMVQLFIKDSEKGVSPAGFEDIEDGSLFAEFHVEDKNIWNWIKEGVLRGFSLEGFFSMEEKFKSEDMAIDFKTLKRTLARLIAKFAQVTTDKGVLTWEGDLEVGKDVYLLREDGEITDAEDGEYIAEDGRTIVVVDSKVAEVREKAEEPAPEAAAEEDPEQIADDVDIHNLAAEVEEIAELKDRVAKLEGKTGETEEALRKMTSAKPAHEEVKSSGMLASGKDEHETFLFNLAAKARK